MGLRIFCGAKFKTGILVGPAELKRAPVRDAPGNAVGERHADTGDDGRVLAFKDGVGTHNRVMAEPGFLRIVAVGVGIVRWRKDRIDDQLG